MQNTYGFECCRPLTKLLPQPKHETHTRAMGIRYVHGEISLGPSMSLQDNWAIATNLLQWKMIRGNILYYRNNNFLWQITIFLLQWFTIVVLFVIFVAIGNELSPQKTLLLQKTCSIATILIYVAICIVHGTFHYFLLPRSTNSLQ